MHACMHARMHVRLRARIHAYTRTCSSVCPVIIVFAVFGRCCYGNSFYVVACALIATHTVVWFGSGASGQCADSRNLSDRSVFLVPSVPLLIGTVEKTMAQGHTAVHLCSALDLFDGAKFWGIPAHQRICEWGPQQLHRPVSEPWEYFEAGPQKRIEEIQKIFLCMVVPCRGLGRLISNRNRSCRGLSAGSSDWHIPFGFEGRSLQVRRSASAAW